MTGRLANKVSIITGGGRGFDEASARRFVQRGFRVAIIDVRDEIGEATAASIRAAGDQATFHQIGAIPNLVKAAAEGTLP